MKKKTTKTTKTKTKAKQNKKTVFKLGKLSDLFPFGLKTSDKVYPYLYQTLDVYASCFGLFYQTIKVNKYSRPDVVTLNKE